MIDTALPQHHQAEVLREEEKYLDALKLYEEVIFLYHQKGDNYNLIEALLGRSLTYKHLYLISQNRSMALIAKHSVLAALDISSEFCQEKKYHCLFRLGEINIILKNYSDAVGNYSDALKLFPTNDAEKGDLIYHLGEAQYLANDQQTGLDNLLKGLDVIKSFKSTTDPYCYDVWLSGCLMKLYLYTHQNQYLDEAKIIIDQNPLLVIRRRQLKELILSSQTAP